MNTIEQYVGAAFEEEEPLEPLSLAPDQAPVLATPAMAYGSLTFAAFMAGNTVIQFDGDEAPTAAGMEDLSGRSGDELLAMRTRHIHNH